MRLQTTLQSRRQGSWTGGTDDADGMGNRPKPKENGTYIVTQEIHSLLTGEFIKTEVTTAQFDAAQGRWLRAKHLKVTAWMKFPEAYKETET